MTRTTTRPRTRSRRGRPPKKLAPVVEADGEAVAVGPARAAILAHAAQAAELEKKSAARIAEIDNALAELPSCSLHDYDVARSAAVKGHQIDRAREVERLAHYQAQKPVHEKLLALPLTKRIDKTLSNGSLANRDGFFAAEQPLLDQIETLTSQIEKVRQELFDLLERHVVAYDELRQAADELAAETGGVIKPRLPSVVEAGDAARAVSRAMLRGIKNANGNVMQRSLQDSYAPMRWR